jgi:glucan phosphoethanolaminetransferase (alkaline phosphatase superfamily)
MRRASRTTCLLSVILPALVLPSCSDESAGLKNILVITLDTTRSDHIGCYGYPLNITPCIDELAKKGVLFENAYAPMPQTLPSHATLFTSVEFCTYRSWNRRHRIREGEVQI